MIRTILVSALLAGSATVAMAADAVEQVPTAPEAVVEEAQVYSWDGAYLGAYGGASWLRGRLDDGVNESSRNSMGGTLGGFAGWNKQLDNNIVLGIEGDFGYDWNNKKFDNGVEAGTDWGGSARARVGYAFDNALIFGTGGWTAANGYVDPAGGNNSKEKVLQGYTLGAGVDYKFTDNMFARAEYRFNDFGEEKIGGTKVDFQQHKALLGLGFKF
ncbi:MAG: porin family protein [Rhizobium sp.]|nr:porin family protein [Rhizobium sp.]